MIDYYVILGITRDADESEIKKAYERKFHKNTDDDVVNNQLLDEAYNILIDKQKRLKYESRLNEVQGIGELQKSAEKALHDGRYGAAIEDFKKIIDIQGTTKRVKELLSYAYSMNKQYYQALKEIKELIEIKENYQYYIEMGNIYGFQGDAENQEASYLKADETESSYETINVLAEFYESNGQSEKAAHYMKIRKEILEVEGPNNIERKEENLFYKIQAHEGNNEHYIESDDLNHNSDDNSNGSQLIKKASLILGIIFAAVMVIAVSVWAAVKLVDYENEQSQVQTISQSDAGGAGE